MIRLQIHALLLVIYTLLLGMTVLLVSTFFKYVIFGIFMFKHNFRLFLCKYLYKSELFRLRPLSSPTII